MITFQFLPTIKEYNTAEKMDAEEYFMKYVGDLKEEFDENDVLVSVNLDAKLPATMYTFTTDKTDIGILVAKLQTYRKDTPYN